MPNSTANMDTNTFLLVAFLLAIRKEVVALYFIYLIFIMNTLLLFTINLVWLK